MSVRIYGGLDEEGTKVSLNLRAESSRVLSLSEIIRRCLEKVENASSQCSDTQPIRARGSRNDYCSNASYSIR